MNHEKSGGEMGKPLSNLPGTNLEQYFNQVVRLGTAEAISIFEWIHRTKEAERTFLCLLDAVDGEVAEEQLLSECGVLFCDGLNIHKQLANAVGWKAPHFSKHSLQRMNEIADRARARRSGDRNAESD
jgi:hypothetical protein